MNILIIEQEQKYLDVLTEVLDNMGNLNIYKSFERCISDIRKNHEENISYDFAIIDLNLPESGAIQLLKILRNYHDENNMKIKILLLSESPNESLVMDFFSLPGDFCRLKTDKKEVFINYLKEMEIIE